MKTALAFAFGVLVGLASFEQVEYWWFAYIGPCRTDSECMHHCGPDEDCDGGPDDGTAAWVAREQARLCKLDDAHCEETR